MNIDYKLFYMINNLAGHSKLLDLFMVSMAKYGVVLYGVFLLILWFWPGPRTENRKLVFKAVLAALIGLGINQLIGMIYFRPRPFVHQRVNMLIDKSTDPSFPSDHATGSSALTFAVLGSRRILGLVMTVFTLLLMVSRVYVGTHYPFDVLGGAVTGLIGSLAANLLWRFIEKYIERLLNFYNRFIPV